MATSKNINDVLVSLEKMISLLGAEKENRIKRLEDKIDRLSLNMDYTPSHFSSSPIRTTSQALEDILYRSGQMSRESWETLRGVVYDYEGDVDDDSVLTSPSFVDEEFSQSEYASYVTKSTPRVVETPKITSSEQIVAKADVPASAESATGGQATSDPKKDS